MRRRAALVPVTVLGLATAAAAAGWVAAGGRSAEADAAPPATAAAVSPSLPAVAATAAVDSLDAPPAGINLRRTVTVQVVQKTKGAVVNISATKIVTQRVQIGPFWQPFGVGEVHRHATSLGSGFLVHADGYVVTNNHVIDQAQQISVELADGQTLPAEVVGADPDADLAVLRIHSPTPLPAMAMGDSGDLMIGEPVIAVGNPLGFSHTVSTGIVSALHRDIHPGPDGQTGPPQPQPVHGEAAALHDLIQTDAAINPGNSGGPLLNAYGQVIGINTAIRGDAQNIGFAIPIDRLRDLIPELMNPSQVTKVDVPLHLAERRTVAEPATVTTRLVTVGERAVGVAAIDGRPAGDVVDAYAHLLSLRAGQAFTVTWDDGHTQRLQTTATPLPDALDQARQRFGLAIEQVTPALADKWGLARKDGLFVTAVDRGGAADQAGVQPGDVIFQFGLVHLATLTDFRALAGRLPASGQARVWVYRGDQRGFLTVRF